MSNLRAEIISSAAEARSQAAISERIVKLEQELAELQIQSQLDKATILTKNSDLPNCRYSLN